MDIKVAQIIEEFGMDIEVREEYSGRGMYGNSTGAIVADSMSSVLQAVGEIMTGADEDDKYLVAEALKEGFRTDSMGLGIVIY